MSINLRRILAGIIDFYIICFLTTTLVLIITLGKLNISAISVISFLLFFFFLLLLKDFLFKNASIGKKIFKIAIIKTDGSNLTLSDSLKRTLTLLLLLPIELFLIIKNNKRIGDYCSNVVVKTGDGSVS